jgi:hypothetical protein
LFNKIYLILSIFCFISCNEKPKPFTYDYVEIGSTDGWTYTLNLKVDNLKRCFISNNKDRLYHDSTFIGYLPDSIQSLVDSIAFDVYNGSDVKLYDGVCEDCGKTAIIVHK